MSQNHSRILAIDPGTRLMGVAILEDGQLLYHGVKIIKKGVSPNDNLQYARRIILGLIKDFEPHILAVEKAFFANNRNASLLNVLVDEIKAIARRKRLKLVAYSPSAVKKFTCGKGTATKKDVSRVVVSKYPELKVYLTQDTAYKERFHQNMFDAVGLGMMAESPFSG